MKTATINGVTYELDEAPAYQHTGCALCMLHLKKTAVFSCINARKGSSCTTMMKQHGLNPIKGYFKRIISDDTILVPKEFTLDDMPENAVIEISLFEGPRIKIGNKVYRPGQKTITYQEWLQKVEEFGSKITSIKPITIGKEELITQPTTYLVIDEEDEIVSEIKSTKNLKLIKK